MAFPTCQCTGLFRQEDFKKNTKLGKTVGMRNCGAPHAIGLDGITPCGAAADPAKTAEVMDGGLRFRCTTCWKSNKAAQDAYAGGKPKGARRSAGSSYYWKPQYPKGTDPSARPTDSVWNGGHPPHVVGGMGGGGFGGEGGAAGDQADIPGKVVRSCGRELKVTPPAHLCILVQHSYARARTPREHDSL